MIFDTMIALAAWVAGFAVLYDFLRQMVIWALVCFESDEEDLNFVRW